MKKKLIILFLTIMMIPMISMASSDNSNTNKQDELFVADFNETSVEQEPKKKWFNIKSFKLNKKQKEDKVSNDEQKTQKKWFNFKPFSWKKKQKVDETVALVDKAIEKYNEQPAVNTNSEAPVLTDIAYHGGITSNRIMEVDECVKIALKNHPAIQSAISNAQVYKSKIAQAWSNYFPTLSAGVSYSRNDAQATNVVPPIKRYDMFYVPTISANMLLFDFGKTKSQADMAKISYESAKYSLETTINTVIYNVKQSYYNLLFALQQVKVYEDTVHDYELHLEQAKAYYDIGKKPKIDVLTAEYNLGKAKLNLIQANNTLKIAYVELSNAMGLSEYSDYDVTDNLSTKAYDVTVEQAVSAAYDTNPELLAALKRAESSEMLVKASKRAFAPDLSAFASYTHGGQKIDTDSGYQIGARLSYQTVNLLLLKKQVDEAKATYEKDYADYKNIKQNIYFEVKQAYLNLVTAQESISVSKLSMDQAKEQYDLAAGRYKVGLGEAIELKDAETTFRNAQLDYYNTLLKYHVSAANLERLMGVPMNKSDIDLL